MQNWPAVCVASHCDQEGHAHLAETERDPLKEPEPKPHTDRGKRETEGEGDSEKRLKKSSRLTARGSSYCFFPGHAAQSSPG